MQKYKNSIYKATKNKRKNTDNRPKATIRQRGKYVTLPQAALYARIVALCLCKSGTFLHEKCHFAYANAPPF